MLEGPLRIQPGSPCHYSSAPSYIPVAVLLYLVNTAPYFTHVPIFYAPS